MLVVYSQKLCFAKKNLFSVPSSSSPFHNNNIYLKALFIFRMSCPLYRLKRKKCHVINNQRLVILICIQIKKPVSEESILLWNLFTCTFFYAMLHFRYKFFFSCYHSLQASKPCMNACEISSRFSFLFLLLLKICFEQWQVLNFVISFISLLKK